MPIVKNKGWVTLEKPKTMGLCDYLGGSDEWRCEEGDSTKGDAEYWGLVLLINHVLV